MMKRRLSGWGRYPALDCTLTTLRSEEQLPRLLGSGTVIARGNGRSYGDAALNPQLTLSMLAMDRILSFDANKGLLTCEAGVLLADILALFAPRGWFAPVVPGTAQVTVGGMIAADVHGKNHHVDGSFGAYVDSLRLAIGGGEVVWCSRKRNPELFRATIGGMGLTGVILSACFRLTRIDSEYLFVETVSTMDLEATMEALATSNDWPYNVVWIDGTASGNKIGRGLLSRATFASHDALSPRLLSRTPRDASRPRPIPAAPLSALFNRWSIRLFNTLYHGAGSLPRGTEPIHYNRFLFPLDRIWGWNRLYGRHGFVQYQCVLPAAESDRGLRAILEQVAASRHRAYLAVLKSLGGEGEGMLSFPMAGHTLALDFPAVPGTLSLLDSLDEITTAHGGRVYLAKDARCPKHHLWEGYPNASSFAEARRRAGDSSGLFSSALSRRLGL